MLNGFTMYSSAPLCRPSMIWRSLSSAVSRMMGMCDVSTSFFSRRHSSSPCMPGIRMSVMTRSGK